MKTKLFFLAFVQVGLVSANTYFISKMAWIPIILCSFLISFTWTHNVKRVVFGEMQDRLIYSTGATIGGIVGLIVSKLITN